MNWQNLPGVVLLLSGVIALLCGMLNYSRCWTWFTIYAALFVLSDVFDLILVGAMPTPMQTSMGVSALAWTLGRMVLVGSLGVFWSILARQQLRRLKK